MPVDLAFIDGMHLSEFAVRDFFNVERHLAPGGVTVFDDVLPRNALEAARVRRTGAWAGDVYKAVEVIARRRPDLLVVLVNTWPTGTALVVGADPASYTLSAAYPAELPYLQADDPQSPPPKYLDRSAAVDPAVLLACGAWPLLAARPDRGSGPGGPGPGCPAGRPAARRPGPAAAVTGGRGGEDSRWIGCRPG